MDTKKKIYSILASLGGLAIIVFIMWTAGFAEIYTLWKNIHIEFFLLAFLSALVFVGFRAIRWYNIIKALDIEPKLRSLYLFTLIGLMVDSITPVMRAGSEPVRTYLLSKEAKVKPSEAFATVVADRFFDLALYIVLCIFAVFLLFRYLNIAASMGYVLIGFVLFLTALLGYFVYLSLNRKAALKAARAFFSLFKKIKSIKPIIENFEQKLEDEIEVYAKAIKKGFLIALLLNLITSILLIGLDVIKLQLIVLALGIHLNVIWILIAMACMIISGSIPSPPGGVGVVEPIGIGALVLSGLPLSSATAIIVTERIISLGLMPLIGMGSTYYLGLKKLRFNN